MTGTEKNVVYKAFGLSISSSIPLPELAKNSEKESRVDIVIEIADLTKLWNELASSQKKSVVKKDLYMFRIPNIATFCVQQGKRIIVSPVKGTDNAHLSLFILGSCMGALLMQRKILPLHGSALAIDGKAYAIVGDSGAGKSTLATALLNKGYRLLSDDVIAVSLTRNKMPFILPSYPQQKLWQESLKDLGMDKDGYCSVFERETKYAVPVPTKFSAEPLPLAGIFELVKSENEQIEIHRIERLNRLHTLLRHTYRKLLISGFGLREWQFGISASIVNQMDFFQLTRPIYGFTAPQLASLILDTLTKEVNCERS